MWVIGEAMTMGDFSRGAVSRRLTITPQVGRGQEASTELRWSPQNHGRSTGPAGTLE